MQRKAGIAIKTIGNRLLLSLSKPFAHTNNGTKAAESRVAASELLFPMRLCATFLKWNYANHRKGN